MSNGAACETTQSVQSLIQHILDTHHAYMRSELPFLETRIAKMCANHGQTRPELFQIQQLLQNLRDDIIPHLEKEEQILFPYASALEASLTTGSPAPHACFPSVQYPIRVMHNEHDTVEGILKELRAVSSNYSVPPGFCENGAEFYNRLAAMEADLHEHIRVENEVLFPRCLELEATAA